MVFQPFDFERTWWKLFQKRIVCTTFGIYVFISIIQEMFGYTKGVIRNRISKDKKIQWPKEQRLKINYIQHTTHISEDLAPTHLVVAEGLAISDSLLALQPSLNVDINNCQLKKGYSLRGFSQVGNNHNHVDNYWCPPS